MNSTALVAFDDLPIVERATYVLTYAVYHPSNFYFDYISADTLPSLVVLVIATSCIFIGAYTTISMPRNTLDPITDTSNPKWHPSDRDDSDYLKTTVSDLANLQTKLDLKTTLAIPVFLSSVLYGMYYAVKHFTTEQILKFFSYYINFCSFPAAFFTSNYVIVAFTRRLHYWILCDGGSWNLIPSRLRITISEDTAENSFPLGLLEDSLKKTDFSKKEDYEAHKKLKLHFRQQGVKFLKPSDIKRHKQKFNFVIDEAKIASFVFASIFSGLVYKYQSANNWLLLNSIAINLSITGISQTSLLISNFKIAGLLLAGLFLYDIYFVFKTEIMLSVATALDVPMKIVIPRQPTIYSDESFEAFRDCSEWGLTCIFDLLRNIDYTEKIPTMLLGLGDIVLPGSYIALCLRFDVFQHYQREQKKHNRKVAFHHLDSYSQPYFISSVIGYIIGLVVTVVVMNIYKQGQPALLYLVPSILASTGVVGFFRGELRDVWNYSEEIPAFKEKVKKDKKKAKKDHVEEEEEDEEEYDEEADRSEFSIKNLLAREFDEEDDDDEDDLSFDEDDGDDEDIDFSDDENDVVELIGAIDDGEQTDLDVYVSTVYSFDTESDDDTFLIESDDNNESDDDFEPIPQEELHVLRSDRKQEPRVWYQD